MTDRRHSDHGASIIEEFDPSELAVLLDFDGTLVEIAATPQSVQVPPSLKHVLSRLRDKLGGALALVSGRPAADLDGFLQPLRLAVVGGHGAEHRLTPDGPIDRSRGGVMDPELRRRLINIAADTDGVLVEDKGYSIALHYRLAPERERWVFDQITLACAELAHDRIEILPGKSLFEVKPPAFNKGIAVHHLMRHPPFAGRRPIFIGDDVTDESVFQVLPEFNGWGFGVGRRFKHTQGMFSTPREVRHWLYELLRGNGSNGGGGG